jgi:hypothetical protein
MSDSFFARWSRRKHAGTRPPREKATPNPDTAEHNEASGAAPRPAEAIVPASLPPIETITAASDIRPFLAAGVPPELTRAALRRAWIADPKIRNFVGLADYDWNFNSPGAMPGFGPIEADDTVRRELSRLLGRMASVDAAATAPAPSESPEQDFIREPSPAADRSASAQLQDRDPSVGPETNPKVDPRQSAKTQDFQQIGRRRHGGALPQSYQGRTVP